jgi:hypothetical protein
MCEVFINYRTGDGDEAAALLERDLSGRFGEDKVFRAARSIAPGDPYAEKLLSAARSCSVLLAVMGPGWARHPQLGDEEDWVRREILTALDHATRVIPVLKGRASQRLSVTDLPHELASLAEVQSLRLDTRDNGADLRRIGDELARLVPALRAADRAASTAGPGDVRNSATDIRGTAVQARDITGDVGTVIKGTRGPVHTGKGNIYHGSQHFSGDRATYIQGDNHGDIDHRFVSEHNNEDKR